MIRYVIVAFLPVKVVVVAVGAGITEVRGDNSSSSSRGTLALKSIRHHMDFRRRLLCPLLVIEDTTLWQQQQQQEHLMGLCT